MSALTLTFLAVGGFALLLLVLSLIGGGHAHAGHVHVGHVDLGHAHVGHVSGVDGGTTGGAAGGTDTGTGGGHSSGVELSLPVIAGFLGALGFSGAIISQLLGGHGVGVGIVAGAVGLVAAVPTAWLAGKLVSAAMNMPTDATLLSEDVLGASGVVVTPVPAEGYGEVRLTVAGQQIKFNARSARPIALGTRVFVIEVPTPTSVLVEPTPEIR
jgi:membrane protein implicated in regulation of membrane protease activity